MTVDLTGLTLDNAAAITEVTVDHISRGEDLPDVVRTKIKLSDKRAALELLGKHLGLFEKDNTQKAPVIILDKEDQDL